MRAMILAAGEGTRLRPLTDRLPKPMLPVAGRPLLVHQIELLRRHGVREIAVNLWHRPQAAIGALGDGSALGVRIAWSIEERLLGTAGGVKHMAPFFADGTFFVLYGDVLTDADLSALLAFHRQRGAALTMALHRPAALRQCGVAHIDGTGRVLEFVEKPVPGEEPSGWANAGVYAVEPEVLDQIPADEPFDFAYELFPLLLARGVPLFGYASDALVVDIGTPERYERAQQAAA